MQENRPPLAGEVLRWSALTAAFIGPGTVTTSAKAGALGGSVLIPVTLAAAGACIFVQYAVARITRSAGRPLPELLAALPGGRMLYLPVAGAILFGCAAFQAGNLTGAAKGIGLLTGWAAAPLLAGLAVGAALVLVKGQRTVLRILLGGFVAAMSLFFIGLALAVPFPAPRTAAAEGELLYLALALFGTTIVPYNVFLGSDLARTASPGRLLPALVISIGTGGLITAALVICGAAVTGAFSFEAFQAALSGSAGTAGALALGTGLFSAGFSSALTAPYAAGLMVREGRPRTMVMLGVTAAGLAAALAGGAPAPVIIAAQTANAFVLPPVLGALWLLLRTHLPQARFLVRGTAILTLVFSGLAVRWVVMQLF